MKKLLRDLTEVKELSKNEKKTINGGTKFEPRCGGDGSFIYVDGKKVCCYQPWSGQYIC